MKPEPDFSRVAFKVNASGSWANLVTVSTERYDEVKKACEVIAVAGGKRIRFKALDAEGGTLEEYSYDGGAYRWHEPKRRR